MTVCFKEAIEYYPIQFIRLSGRVAERLKAAASKAVEGLVALREFESHPFRHKITVQFYIKNFAKIFLERCPSWPKEHDWKSCVLSKAAPRVRIPLSPPCLEKMPKMPKIENV